MVFTAKLPWLKFLVTKSSEHTNSILRKKLKEKAFRRPQEEFTQKRCPVGIYLGRWVGKGSFKHWDGPTCPGQVQSAEWVRPAKPAAPAAAPAPAPTRPKQPAAQQHSKAAGGGAGPKGAGQKASLTPGAGAEATNKKAAAAVAVLSRQPGTKASTRTSSKKSLGRASSTAGAGDRKQGLAFPGCRPARLRMCTHWSEEGECHIYHCEFVHGEAEMAEREAEWLEEQAWLKQQRKEKQQKEQRIAVEDHILDQEALIPLSQEALASMKRLLEMGFESASAESAGKASGGVVTVAVQLLTGSATHKKGACKPVDVSRESQRLLDSASLLGFTAAAVGTRLLAHDGDWHAVESALQQEQGAARSIGEVAGAPAASLTAQQQVGSPAAGATDGFEGWSFSPEESSQGEQWKGPPGGQGWNSAKMSTTLAPSGSTPESSSSLGSSDIGDIGLPPHLLVALGGPQHHQPTLAQADGLAASSGCGSYASTGVPATPTLVDSGSLQLTPSPVEPAAPCAAAAHPLAHPGAHPAYPSPSPGFQGPMHLLPPPLGPPVPSWPAGAHLHGPPTRPTSIPVGQPGNALQSSPSFYTLPAHSAPPDSTHTMPVSPPLAHAVPPAAAGPSSTAPLPGPWPGAPPAGADAARHYDSGYQAGLAAALAAMGLLPGRAPAAGSAPPVAGIGPSSPLALGLPSTDSQDQPATPDPGGPSGAPAPFSALPVAAAAAHQAGRELRQQPGFTSQASASSTGLLAAPPASWPAHAGKGVLAGQGDARYDMHAEAAGLHAGQVPQQAEQEDHELNAMLAWLCSN
ncbi:hypothetical protein N2152v2_003116 [Parachlorella kessleri]